MLDLLLKAFASATSLTDRRKYTTFLKLFAESLKQKFENRRRGSGIFRVAAVRSPLFIFNLKILIFACW